MYQKDIQLAFWNSAFLFFSKIGVVLFGLGTVTLTTRLLGAANYGRFSIIFMIAQFMMFAFVSWTSSSVTRYGREEFLKTGKINKVFWARFSLLSCCLLIGVSILLVFRGAIANYIDAPVWIVWFLVAHFLIYSSSEFLFFIFQALNRLKAVALIEFTEAAVLFLLILFIKFFIGYSLPILATVVGAYLACKILVGLVSLFRLNLSLLLPFKIDLKTLRIILWFSSPFIFGSLAVFSLNWLDLAVIKKFLNLNDVGIYALPLKISNMIIFIGSFLNTVLVPVLIGFIAVGKSDLIVYYVRRIIPQIIFLWLLIIFAGFTVVPIFVPLFFTDAFVPSILPLSILMGANLVNIFIILYSPVGLVYELSGLIVSINILIAVINIALDLVFVPLIGVNGAAIAKLIAYTIGAISWFWVIGKRLKLRERRQFLIILPFALSFGIVFIVPGVAGIFVSLPFFFFSSYLIARHINLFRPDDKLIFDKIDMPSFVRRRLYAFIDFLSPVL